MKHSSLMLLAVLLSVCPSFAQNNKQCLIVKQNKGHRVRNGFLFGVAGLAFSKGERFEYVDRLFFRDVLGLRAVDVGDGWLILALPRAEAGIHPTDVNSKQLHGAVIFSPSRA